MITGKNLALISADKSNLKQTSKNATPLSFAQGGRRAATKEKIKSARQGAKTQRTRKAFLCETFAALRLCVRFFASFLFGR